MTAFDMRLHCFDVWLALGCPPLEFDGWYDGDRMTSADAWAQLLCSISGNVEALCKDTNPPAHPALVDAARLRVRLS